MEPVVIQTKICAPTVQKVLSRQRLLDFIGSSVGRKLLLVCAGPGYGKTSLLADFAQRSELPVCWYTLDSFDQDPGTFLGYLVEAVRLRFPGFGAQTLAVLQHGGIHDLRGSVGVLVNELAGLGADKVVIVLDEYQFASEEVHKVLALLLEYLPRNIHVIVASRTTPPFPHIRLLAYAEVDGIGPDLLRFTEDEVQAVLRQCLDMDLPEEKVHEMTQKSEGWITGILLGVQVMWQRLSGFLNDLALAPDRVYRYMTTEVLAALPPDRRRFLTQAGILNRVEADVCDTLLERTDSAEILRWMEASNLFLVSVGKNCYRFHGLFRDSLLREARADPEEFARLNLRAADLWRQRGETQQMVEHLLLAGAFDEAARQIENEAGALFVQGRFQVLANWTAALPEQVARSRSRLVLYRAKALLEMGRVEDARTLLPEVQKWAAEVGDTQTWLQARADLALCLRLQGDYAQALQVARETLGDAGEAHLSALVDLNRTVGICLVAQGDLAAAEAHFRAAVEASRCVPAFDQALALQDLGLCLLNLNRDGADQVAEQALERWRSLGVPGPLANTLNNLAMRPFLRGDFEEAEGMLQEALEVSDMSLSPHYRGLVRASLADLYRDQGRLGDAWLMVWAGLDLAKQAENAGLTTYLLEAAGNLYRLQGLPADARRYLQHALALAGSSFGDQVRIWISLAFLEIFEGRYAEADRLLDAVLPTMGEKGERLQFVRARVAHAASCYYQHRAEALDLFRQAVDLAMELDILEPLAAEINLLRPLLQTLIEHGALLMPKVRRWVRSGSVASAVSAMVVRERQLGLLAFGPGRVYRGGVEVKTWRGQLPRELFFFLYYNAPATRDQIMEALWGDSEATDSLHNMLNRARNAVGDFITFQHSTDLYVWNPDVSCQSDVDLFLRAVAEADRLPHDAAGVRILLEQAVVLYKGDFLEGFYHDWVASRRQELGAVYLQALLRAARICEQLQSFTDGRELYRQAVEADSYCEEAYRGMMRCYAAEGHLDLAVRAYLRCQQVLWDELDALPAAETKGLYAAITGQGGAPVEGHKV